MNKAIESLKEVRILLNTELRHMRDEPWAKRVNELLDNYKPTSKNAIIVDTNKGYLVKAVDNFSAENVKAALGSIIGVDPAQIEQARANTSDGIYTIKERLESAREFYHQGVWFSSNECDTWFRVQYGYVQE
jgi:hypothetical protein